MLLKIVLFPGTEPSRAELQEGRPGLHPASGGRQLVRGRTQRHDRNPAYQLRRDYPGRGLQHASVQAQVGHRPAPGGSSQSKVQLSVTDTYGAVTHKR